MLLNTFFFKIDLFSFWLHWVFVAVPGLFLAAASEAASLLQCTGFSLWVRLPLLWSMASGVTGLQQLWHAEAAAVARSLAAPQHVGSSQTRERTCVSCAGRRVLNHWTTTEVLSMLFKAHFLLNLFAFSKSLFIPHPPTILS